MSKSISDLRGIDISSWQAGMSASALNSVDFAILKISEGQSWVDPQFDNFYNMAKIPLGAYVYSHAVTEAEARAEANKALSLANGRKLPLGIYMDVEEQKQLALRDSELTAVVKAFCDTIKAGGYRAGAYGSNGNLWAKVGVDYLGSDVIMWTAQWGGRPQKGDVWQFTASDHIDGYSERVDGNKVLSERFARLITEDTPAPEPTPEPEPAGETCEVKMTMPVLYPDPMTKKFHVELAQDALIKRGYDFKYGSDGYFGPATQSALEHFQKDNGLTVSSKFDAPTWAKLLGV